MVGLEGRAQRTRTATCAVNNRPFSRQVHAARLHLCQRNRERGQGTGVVREHSAQLWGSFTSAPLFLWEGVVMANRAATTTAASGHRIVSASVT